MCVRHFCFLLTRNTDCIISQQSQQVKPLAHGWKIVVEGWALSKHRINRHKEGIKKVTFPLSSKFHWDKSRFKNNQKKEKKKTQLHTYVVVFMCIIPTSKYTYTYIYVCVYKQKNYFIIKTIVYLNNISKPHSYFCYLFHFSRVWKSSVGNILIELH